ncbi:HAMP domain-containing histidine kinase [Actinomadura sp. PM05-2]|uniref:histidine kinase n=1 Tax=Actinomadura parmotrematis TaxID=2864039 RepID=A0ABS7FMI0_9ACTN|nr:HAMP domain-containing histidine kinase [Actinomadura parmotrematis]
MRARVTLTSAVVTALVSAVLYVVTLVLVREYAMRRLDAELSKEGRRLVARLSEAGGISNPLLPTGGGELLQVVDGSGRIAGASARMQGYPKVDFPATENDDTRRAGVSCRIRAPGGPCFYVVEYQPAAPAGGWTVYALASKPGLFPDPWLAAGLALCVPLLAGLAGYGTWRSAGRTLRPVERIRAELDEITTSDLGRRVPVPAHRDEIAALAASVNATLDRLEAAVARLQAFVSDVSHELRSPVTALRTELELALADPSDEAALRHALEATLVNTDRLQAVLEDLLALARLDAQRRLEFEPVELGGLVDEVVLRRPRRSRVRIDADEAVIVNGGRDELGRLLANLVDNADRHADTEVAIAVAAEDGAAVVQVVDDGGGIAPADREKVFERFTRLAEGRHRDAGGTGLGLAIARDIAAAHDGTLDITDRPDGGRGARFVLRLPLAADDPP